MPDELNVAVVGAGLMGAQIGVEYALGGHTVSFVVRDEEGSRARIETAFELAVAAGIASDAQAAAAAATIELIDSVERLDLATELVIESIPEQLELKSALLRELARRLPAAILASNTSSIQLTVLGDAVGAPERIIGTHYWNPPLLMPPVEVIPGARTEQQIVDRVCALLTKLGKEPVVAADVPGFIWNRLQSALLREVLWLVENGVATPRQIDELVKSGLARRLRYSGPFETIALGGLASWTRVAENLFPHLSNATRPGAIETWLEHDSDELAEVRARRDAGLTEELARSLRPARPA
jgi:3-hydroxybutyryl-CoA dehydrogenase